jgi:DNA-binding HxlR family transcriptional regulator
MQAYGLSNRTGRGDPERWTPLVIRELALVGSRRFNDIQRGVPLMSSSLLTKRLRQLARAGIGERRARPDGRGSVYQLTPAGQELGPVLAQKGIWSERGLRRPIFEEAPDTGLLMWWVCGTVKTDALPAGSTVIHFRFREAPEELRYFWLVLPEAGLCPSDPGFGVDITVSSDPKTRPRCGWATSIWRRRSAVAPSNSKAAASSCAPSRNGSACTRCRPPSTVPAAVRESSLSARAARR